MRAVSLPARIGYAAVALPLGGWIGFETSIWLLPRVVPLLQQPDMRPDGHELFVCAIEIAAALAFTLGLAALILPWIRHRKRRGRTLRIVLSGVFVVVASLGFAGQGHALIYDLAFAAWLTYTVAFTFVRYGVIDQASRRSSPAGASSSPYPAN